MSLDLEAAMAAAQAAAESAFRTAGMDDPKVMVNVAWRGARGAEYVAGSSAQPGMTPFLADSLRQSADEVEEAAAA
jgi:hypothetical protein